MRIGEVNWNVCDKSYLDLDVLGALDSPELYCDDDLEQFYLVGIWEGDDNYLDEICGGLEDCFDEFQKYREVDDLGDVVYKIPVVWLIDASGELSDWIAEGDDEVSDWLSKPYHVNLCETEINSENFPEVFNKFRKLLIESGIFDEEEMEYIKEADLMIEDNDLYIYDPFGKNLNLDANEFDGWYEIYPNII